MNLLEIIIQRNKEDLQEEIEKLKQAENLAAIIAMAWKLVRIIGKSLVEEELRRRDKKKRNWPKCIKCNKRIENKGKRRRTIITSLGKIRIKRKIGRCPSGCQTYTPLDKEVNINKYQRVSLELQKLGCMLAIFIPYLLSTVLLEKILSIKISPQTLWHWVQDNGLKASEMVEREHSSMTLLSEEIEKNDSELPLIIGADGVMAPFRPKIGTPEGKTVFKEVKVGIFARLKQYTNTKGKEIARAVHKRFVAVWTGKEEFRRQMAYESRKHRIKNNALCAWISDGGKGFWNIYEDIFFHKAIGILDFYHLMENLSKVAKAIFDGRTNDSKDFFNNTRKDFLEGNYLFVLSMLANLSQEIYSSSDHPKKSVALKALSNFYSYVKDHIHHIDYPKFKSLQLPIGSGIIESACKYLIQQRFKSVGMRWSDIGFDNLLHLRLAWFNDRFDSVFQYHLSQLRFYPPIPEHMSK